MGAITQGFGCFAAFTLGFAIPRFQRLESLFAHYALTRTSDCTRFLWLNYENAVCVRELIHVNGHD